MLHEMNVKEHSVDLLLFGDDCLEDLDWQYGESICLENDDENFLQEINSWASSSQSDYLLVWNKAHNLPKPEIVFSIIEGGAGIAHCGLKQGFGASLQDLCMLGFSWDKLNSPPEIVSTSWRLVLDTCLVRRELLLAVGGLDAVFQSHAGAGLEFGYRCLKLGAVIEHHPDLCTNIGQAPIPELPVHDLYCFILRHFKPIWGRYIFYRRMLRTVSWINESKSWQSAQIACTAKPANWSLDHSAFRMSIPDSPLIAIPRISVIIPTLGRYDYIRGALTSLLEQTLPSYEVIVIDQNPPETRQPGVYEGYEKINLRVIWQNERGQSLARNTGLAAATGEYVFLFDDDSIAYPDLLERHLAPVHSGRYDVSTGVALPPPPTSYILPKEFLAPRLSQTLDTGNCLMRLDLIRHIGGLDRNFDFGPGADADLGTRLYLAGYRILHNPDAIRIHFKAPGGLRVHGAYKYNTDLGLLQPFPPITQSYYALRYLTPRQRRENVLLDLLFNKFPRHVRRFDQVSSFRLLTKLFAFLVSIIFLPLKQKRSLSEALKLYRQGTRLENFPN